MSEAKYEFIILSLSRLFSSPSLTSNTEAIISNQQEFLNLFSFSRKLFYTYLFNFLAFEISKASENGIYNFLTQLINNERQSVELLLEKLKINPAKKSGLADTLHRIIKKDKEQFNHTNPDLNEKTKPDTSEQGPGENNQHLKSDHRQYEGASSENPETDDKAFFNAKLPPSKEYKGNEVYSVPDEGMYISNAGLVLLNPFLPHFFSEAELLTAGNEFISPDAQHKAAVLLYYLQTGDIKYREWDMLLNKILCGINTEDVLQDGIILSDKEMLDCNELLETVVSYWEALKGASTDALQNTFLSREGKVSWKEDHWLLQVERTGVDILLERLPWGFSTIKLPWLNYIIHTEW